MPGTHASEKSRSRTTRSAPRFFRIRDIADFLSVSTRTVRRWIESGALIAHRLEGVVRVSEADFAAFLAVRRTV